VSASDWIRAIGISHLLQPPLTLLLASSRGVSLRDAVVTRTRLAEAVVTNMALASVALPTALGALLAVYATEARDAGPARALGVVLSVFWCWRLYRQLFVLRAVWPRSTPTATRLDSLLILIFVAQGPCLGWLLLH
jgi:hypothetical protein